jgi:uncharacterized lipoprotein
MKQLVLGLLFAFALSACGSSDEKPTLPSNPDHPPSEMFVWADPGIASGNVDADYAACTTQIEKDPAVTPQTPQLALIGAYIQCMTAKGWKFVDPNAATQP